MGFARHNFVSPAGIPHPSDFDPTNTTIFIGGLSPGITEEDLRNVFGTYGEIIYTKVPANKGCGFCQFVERSAAENAMQALQGQVRKCLCSIGLLALSHNLGHRLESSAYLLTYMHELCGAGVHSILTDLLTTRSLPASQCLPAM